jgi:hypothetical protein
MSLRQPRSRPWYHRAGPQSQLVDGRFRALNFQIRPSCLRRLRHRVRFGKQLGPGSIQSQSRQSSPTIIWGLRQCRPVPLPSHHFHSPAWPLAALTKILRVRGKNHTRRGILSSRRIYAARTKAKQELIRQPGAAPPSSSTGRQLN